MNRRGFTLTELLMGMTVMAILGVALTRILINDGRFVSRQDAMLASRSGARAAFNTLLSELAMVADSAVTAATRDSITVRIPYAFGVTCRSNGTNKVINLMPVDSVAWASTSTTPSVYVRQNSATVYQRFSPVTITTAPASDSSFCRQDSVRAIAGGKLLDVSGSSIQLQDSLALVMVYERVTYKFAPSADLPGRIGLWRFPNGGTAEELVAPFDTSASFAYLMGGPKTANPTLRTTTVTGAALDSIRGVELRLYAASENTAQGTAAPQVFKLKTRIRFANKVT